MVRTVTGAPGFRGIAEGQWYTNAVAWAAKNEIISGYGNGIFGTQDPTTREQVVAILWRYAGSPEISSAETVSDAAAVSGWAQAAVRWANANGILDGMIENRQFVPK